MKGKNASENEGVRRRSGTKAGMAALVEDRGGKHGGAAERAADKSNAVEGTKSGTTSSRRRECGRAGGKRTLLRRGWNLHRAASRGPGRVFAAKGTRLGTMPSRLVAGPDVRFAPWRADDRCVYPPCFLPRDPGNACGDL